MLSSAVIKLFFSARLYKNNRLRVHNEINRYLGTKSPGLKLNSADSLPIYVQCHRPSNAQSTNGSLAHDGALSGEWKRDRSERALTPTVALAG